jgi:hypothetical protein
VAYQLYRHFNEAGEPLYVGISMSAFRKLTVPEITAGWFPEIRTITITPYRTGAEAAAAEIEAIKNEPRYNQQHHR